jgi:hypothetical protein
LAEETPRILELLKKLSAELKLVIVGSLPEKDNDTLYNTLYVADEGKIVDSYRKLHMFSTMGEDRFLSPGNRTCVVPTSAGRLGLAICYDLRFPELFRKMALEGAEILCIPAEWPKPRQEHWRTLFFNKRAVTLFPDHLHRISELGGDFLIALGKLDVLLRVKIDVAQRTVIRFGLRGARGLPGRTRDFALHHSIHPRIWRGGCCGRWHRLRFREPPLRHT